MEEKLKSASHEIVKLKKRARKHVIEKTSFKRMKSLWEAEKVSKLEIISSEAQYFT